MQTVPGSKMSYQRSNQAEGTGAAFAHKNDNTGTNSYSITPYETTLISAEDVPMSKTTVIFNFVLHIVSAVVTIVGGAYGINKGKDLAVDAHIESWSYVMVFGTTAALVLTLLLHGLLVPKPMMYPILTIILAGLFFMTYGATLQLSYWVSTRASEALGTSHAGTHTRHSAGDNWIILSAYLQAFVLASLVFTPISGTYAKK